MTRVFFSVTMSLDGFIAPEMMKIGVPLEQWLPQWMELQAHVFEQQFFRENLNLEETYNRTGVSIMGKRMFDGGEATVTSGLQVAPT